MSSPTATDPAAPKTSVPPVRLPVRDARAERDPDRALILVLLALALLPRLLVFPFTDNLYGDAVVRTELAQQLVDDPHVITSYASGARQFGPLHLYATALPLALGVDRQDAGRWVSLFFGVLSVWPLFLLTRRLFGRQEAIWACLAWTVWGMHIQMSTTAGSEALSTFLLLGAIAWFAQGWEEGRLGPLAGSAVLLNLACATRYEVWLLLPLLALLLAFQGKDRVASVTRAVFFGLLVTPFPIAWMQGNELAHGDPLYPIRMIESFHRGWVSGEAARVGGGLVYRVHNLFFWPAIAILTLSPVVAFLGFKGMWRTWRESEHDRWLVWVVLVPTAVFTFRSAVLMNFAPLARFTVGQLALLLPFVGVGASALFEGKSRLYRRGLVALTAALALAFPIGTAALTFQRDHGVASILRPVSPVTTNPRPVAAVAGWLTREVAPGSGSVVFDEAAHYHDLQLAFYSGLPESRIARVRWGEGFETRLEELPAPTAVITSEDGTFLSREDVTLSGRQLTWDGVRFREVVGFPAPFRVWQRIN